MKIKIVVRPEDAQGADAAAENVRRLRQRRARWGLAALLGLIALSAATAFFFIGRGTSPTPEEQPVASAPPAPEAEEPRPPGPAGVAPAAGVASDIPATSPQAIGEREAEGRAASDDQPAPAPAEGAQAVPPAPATPAAPPAPTRPAPGETAAVSVPVAPPTSSRPPATAPSEAAKAPVVAKVPAKPDAGVVRAQLALRVIDREPGEPLQSPVNVGAGARTVYYFTEFRNLRGQTVTHRWEYDGRVTASIPFRVEGNRWRVYSSKRIGESQRGLWRVTAVDKAGAVLARAEFSAE